MVSVLTRMLRKVMETDGRLSLSGEDSRPRAEKRSPRAWNVAAEVFGEAVPPKLSM